MDETYIRVKGEWKYPYRAVDKDGNTIDFLLRAHRDKTAARRYFEKAIAQNGVPETVTIDKSGANIAALEAINDDRETPIRIRQSRYLNNLVGHDHRAIKRRTRPMLDFKTFRCARILLGGIEIMHMIVKGQMKCAPRYLLRQNLSNWSLATAKRFLQSRQQHERPAMHGRVIDCNSTPSDLFFNVTQAQRIGNVPAHASQDHVERIMQALEYSGHRRIQRRHRACTRSCHSAHHVRTALLQENPKNFTNSSS
ncbi:hypothetical protein BN2475_60004 [Paraburkholderia ribeironis]|uniref:DDE domain-containing protein n=1 Tax=Paraburkholderia ribeironis TaxID=1247936 RepID=A0A1N7RLE8_9BURK|nr:hypothetical protein BN2475_60004 [Paraburkholderia ribeironis]